LNGRDRIGPSKAATSHATQIAAGLVREQLRDHLVDHVFGPPVTLCTVSRDADGLISLSVAIGREPERTLTPGRFRRDLTSRSSVDPWAGSGHVVL